MPDPGRLPDPKDKPFEPDDPMLLNGAPVDGDPAVMLDSIIEEYAMMGWDEHMIGKLFELPFFQATHGLKARLGEDAIRRRIREVLSRIGVLRFRTEEKDDAGSNGGCDHA